ncbi:MAG TPA: glycosyltransferase [Mycobacterium sp.]|nr:glycosyltransferase [Mycobacterium sp.]
MIAYYVHHHGRGHLNRALSICAQLDEPVVFLSSLPRPQEVRDRDMWVRLPMDIPDANSETADVTARGRLHWAPLHVDGLARRSAKLLQTLVATRPRRVVVDVSVEVSLLARLAGVPVTVMAMPGDRTDAAHRLAYDLADSIIAPWSVDVHRPDSLIDHSDRTHFVGAISRFDGAQEQRSSGAASSQPVALLLAGAGGTEVPADALDQLRSALPRYRWVAAGGVAAWIDDLWPTLVAADLVVSHAGQNAIADIALCGKAAIVIPQHRPFGEQHATARALAETGMAVVTEAWPALRDWPDLASKAASLDSRRWKAMNVHGAAARAAAVIAA